MPHNWIQGGVTLKKSGNNQHIYTCSKCGGQTQSTERPDPELKVSDPGLKIYGTTLKGGGVQYTCDELIMFQVMET